MKSQSSSQTSVATRVFLAFTLTLFGLAAVTIVSVLEHDRSSRQLRLLHDVYLPLALRISEAHSHAELFRRHVETLSGSGDALPWLRAAVSVRPSLERRLLADLEQAEASAASTRLPADLQPVRRKLEAVFREFRRTSSSYAEMFRVLDQNQPHHVNIAMLHESEQRNERNLSAAYRHVSTSIDEVARGAAERERLAAYWLFGLGVFALGLGTTATFSSARLLSPLAELEKRVARVASGDLTPSSETIRGRHEIARLSRGFEGMLRTLSARDERLTELRVLQDRMIRGLRSGLVVVNGEGIVLATNPRAITLLDLPVAAVGQDLGLLGTLSSLTGAALLFQDVRQGTSSASSRSVPFRREPSAKQRLLDVTFARLDDRGENFLLAVEDVTEEIETKERLIQTERLAAIGRMAAHVTHEVRNPLTSIGLNVEMLADELGGQSAEATHLIAAVRKEIDRLTAITEEYLNLARLPAPRLETEDLASLVRSLASFVEPEFKQAGVTLKVGCPDEVDIEIDASQIRQALLNLLRNALEASTQSHGVVTLEIHDSDNTVEVRVRDTGPGVANETLPRIFDLFFSTKARGTGLGLPLSRQIAVSHRGDIRCTSDNGGTQFSMFLPKAKEKPPFG